MQLLSASLDALGPLDVHALYKLRVDVFVYEQRTPYAEIDDIDAASSTTHILAFDDTTLIGCARVHPERIDGVRYLRFGRFALLPQARGKGVAQAIMAEAIRLAGDLPMYLSAQAALDEYYGQYGFEPAGEVYLDTGAAHLPMVRPATK